MGRSKNDGRGRLGGREAGTPNKVTLAVRETISTTVGNYFNSPALRNDLASLDPKDRLMILAKLIEYVIPKAVQEPQEEEGDRMTVVEDTIQRLTIARKVADGLR